jgi:UDP-N-acetylmuramoyl-tripeptide--D-alanyl-D-alanine ligase
MEISSLYKEFVASNGISTDTRKIEKDTIYFALKGANFNGNEFAESALNEGCLFAIVDEAQYAVNEKCILVDDVLKTLQDLANYHRQQFNIPVIGITGSNGKTTTKELIGAVLEKKYNLLITEGNLNNHLGVPFTLLRLTADHEMAVIEMGANKPGDIQELVEIAEPTHGIITNIGAAHIEGFGSLEGVIKTKTELYQFIHKTRGELFINQEDEVLKAKQPEVTCFSYGEKEGDLLGDLEALTPFVCFSWSYNDYKSPTIETNLVGRYNFTNFLAAVAIGKKFEVANEDINAALSEYTPSNNRSQVQKTERNTLIVDCYNANPTSMKAAIESFSEVDHQPKLAILGDMLELGDISKEEHQKVVGLLQSKGIEAILVGEEFASVESPYPHCATHKDVANDLKLDKLNNTLVLLKGSRGIKLESIIQYL